MSFRLCEHTKESPGPSAPPPPPPWETRKREGRASVCLVGENNQRKTVFQRAKKGGDSFSPPPPRSVSARPSPRQAVSGGAIRRSEKTEAEGRKRKATAVTILVRGGRGKIFVGRTGSHWPAAAAGERPHWSPTRVFRIWVRFHHDGGGGGGKKVFSFSRSVLFKCRGEGGGEGRRLNICHCFSFARLHSGGHCFRSLLLFPFSPGPPNTFFCGRRVAMLTGSPLQHFLPRGVLNRSSGC